jgi:hypothetical protein
MTAGSARAGRCETFYASCPGGVRDGSVVQLRAVADKAILGIDPEGFVEAGRAPHLDLAVQKVSGQPGPMIQDGDTIALRKPRPSWLPGQRYVRAGQDDGMLRFTRGRRNGEAEFVVVKAREILQVEVPKQGEGQGKITLKDLAAPAGGVQIEITSSHPEQIEVQKSVMIPEGQREATFKCSRAGAPPTPGVAGVKPDIVITATAVTTGDGASAHVTAAD